MVTKNKKRMSKFKTGRRPRRRSIKLSKEMIGLITAALVLATAVVTVYGDKQQGADPKPQIIVIQTVAREMGESHKTLPQSNPPSFIRWFKGD